MKIPVPFPDNEDKLSQDASAVTVQLLFEVTLMVPVAPADEATVIPEGAADNDGTPSDDKVTLKDISVPAAVTSDIFNPPALPSCRKLFGFELSFILVLPAVDEK